MLHAWIGRMFEEGIVAWWVERSCDPADEIPTLTFVSLIKRLVNKTTQRQFKPGRSDLRVIQSSESPLSATPPDQLAANISLTSADFEEMLTRCDCDNKNKSYTESNAAQ